MSRAGLEERAFVALLSSFTCAIPRIYIRRAALQTMDLFNEEHFNKGYDEENDFCIRAAQAGWRNLHALDTFVRHFGGVSFGEAKSPRERAAMQTLRRLHPRYEGDVLRFV